MRTKRIYKYLLVALAILLVLLVVYLLFAEKINEVRASVEKQKLMKDGLVLEYYDWDRMSVYENTQQDLKTPYFERFFLDKADLKGFDDKLTILRTEYCEVFQDMVCSMLIAVPISSVEEFETKIEKIYENIVGPYRSCQELPNNAKFVKSFISKDTEDCCSIDVYSWSGEYLYYFHCSEYSKELADTVYQYILFQENRNNS